MSWVLALGRRQGPGGRVDESRKGESTSAERNSRREPEERVDEIQRKESRRTERESRRELKERVDESRKRESTKAERESRREPEERVDESRKRESTRALCVSVAPLSQCRSHYSFLWRNRQENPFLEVLTKNFDGAGDVLNFGFESSTRNPHRTI